METGNMRHGSGGRGIGRRLRVGAAGTIVVGGAIFLGGAAGLVTAFANTGGVAVAQDCTTWSASARLDDNVTNRLVTVTSTIPTVPGYSQVISTDGSNGSTKGAVTIVDKTGSAPQSGSITEIIYNSDTVASGIEQQYTATLPAPTDCNASIVTHQSADSAVGTALSDTATVTGTAGSPAGTVIFTLFPPSNTSCSTATGAAKPVFTSAAINLTSTTPGISTAASGPYMSTAVGTYHWVAAYTPATSLYKSAVSGCTLEPVTVSQVSPTIATTASAGGVVPVSVSNSATVSGGLNPTGSVTFSLYSSSTDCTAGTNAVYTSPAEALASGKASSGSFSVTTAGTYQWVAKYSGDANNKAASSACGDEPVTTTTGGAGGVQAISTPSTGSTGSLTGITVGGFLLLGGLGVALMGAIIPRRRRTQ